VERLRRGGGGDCKTTATPGKSEVEGVVETTGERVFGQARGLGVRIPGEKIRTERGIQEKSCYGGGYRARHCLLGVRPRKEGKQGGLRDGSVIGGVSARKEGRANTFFLRRLKRLQESQEKGERLKQAPENFADMWQSGTVVEREAWPDACHCGKKGRNQCRRNQIFGDQTPGGRGECRGENKW